MKPERGDHGRCHTQPIETTCSCVILKAGSVKNAILLKSPCGVAGTESVFSRGREDPEEKPRKRDRKDEEPHGKEDGTMPGTPHGLTLTREK